ncbi:unnamed protein product [Rotaria sp. Silwood2]|nr:unnamed protein product [Rotaria sp. Silwood2]CAF4109838.1 unnamed protein product [Rotaria sp. Silwood2]
MNTEVNRYLLDVLWVHLLIQQDIEITDVQYLYINHYIQPGYDPNLHAVWLGICLCDDHVLMSSLYVNGDKGIGSLIYSSTCSHLTNISIHSERIVHVTGDMMSFDRLRRQAAVEHEFLNSNDLNKYFVGGMNIG